MKTVLSHIAGIGLGLLVLGGAAYLLSARDAGAHQAAAVTAAVKGKALRPQMVVA